MLNHQLDANAPADDLQSLASRGIRGELIFPVPCLLERNPRLLGYYRLLLGYSQKEFYNKGKLGRFSSLEERGIIPDKTKGEISDLCKAFGVRCSELLAGLGVDRVSASLLDDLTLLTLGAQLRGSNNTKIGKKANQEVFDIIERAVGHTVTQRTESKLEIRNASDREVVIAFSFDPDISIVEFLSSTDARNVVAIEIKGGGDSSNIWNRLGEAEKSHRTAKERGFVECWTIYNVPSIDVGRAKVKSPTTDRFYRLAELKEDQSPGFRDFRNRLLSLVGIKGV